MSSQYIFTMYKLSRTHPPDKQVLKDISLSFMPGAKIGVLGLNGSGKSTLLRIMAGQDTEYRGDAQLAPGATVGLLEQEPQLDETKDVRGNVEEGVAELRGLLDRFNELAANYSDETADEFARLQEQIDAADAWNLDTQLDTAMDALRLPPADADVTKLSGGERRRVALCRLLLSAPDLLLLDEPTNHLDAESVGWLERHLEEYKGTVVAVTHDRYFLDNVAGWILELDRGHGLPFKGNYSSWLEQKQARLAQEERKDSARKKTIEQELAWVRENPKGRRKKAKARLNNYERLLAEDRNVKLDQVQIHIPAGQRLGDKVIESDALRKGFGERLLIEDLSFTLPPAGIVGVIGANGAGKTTSIQGRRSPDAVPVPDPPAAAHRRAGPGTGRNLSARSASRGSVGEPSARPEGRERVQSSGRASAAICRSSRASTTKVRTVAPEAVISSPRRSDRSATPSQASRSATSARSGAACSPTPPVNTSASRPSERGDAAAEQRRRAGGGRRRARACASSSSRSSTSRMSAVPHRPSSPLSCSSTSARSSTRSGQPQHRARIERIRSGSP